MDYSHGGPHLDAAAVAGWLGVRGVDLRGPVEASLLTGGRSNLTFKLVDADGRALVVRRPPLGNLLRTAHDMSREWRYLAALVATPVPVPAPVALCDDVGVIGAPFLVMEFVDGVVIHGVADAMAMTAAERAAAAASLVDALASLHAVEPARVGLAGAGACDYVRRQIDRWSRQYEASADAAHRPVSGAVVDGARRLAAAVPPTSRIGVVHGDFRLGNCILGSDGEVAAVVDWELATVGSVLADLGWLLATWFEPGERQTSTGSTSLSGFPTGRALVRRYGERTSIDLADIDYFVALGRWKAAAVLAGVATRTGAGAYGRRRDTTRIHSNAEAMAAAALDVLDGNVSYRP
jgi:aminoglycoside phosphotransferase (APT) family kinase protein